MVPRALKGIVILSLVAFGLLALSQLASGATFNPISTSCLDNTATAGTPCDGDYTGGVSGNATVGLGNLANVFKLNAPDSNFSLVTTFTPPGWCVATTAADCSTVDGSNNPTGGTVPVVGGQTGTNASTATLGLCLGGALCATTNTPCNNAIPVSFNFYVSRTSSPGPVLTVIDGKVDFNGNTVIDAGDDGVVSGRQLIDGLFDLNGTLGNGNGFSGDTGVPLPFPDPSADDGYVEHNLKVHQGLVDVNRDGLFDTSDDGTIDAGLVSGDIVQIPNNSLQILVHTPDSGSALPNFVSRYPAYNLDILDPNGVQTVADGDIIYPRLRSAGTTIVSGTDVILQFLIFDKGALTALSANPPYSQFTAGKGYPSFTVLQDPTTGTSANPQPASAGSIVDFCSPLVSTTATLATTVAGIGGVGGGVALGRNALADGGSPPCLAGGGPPGGPCGLSTGGVTNTGTHLLQAYARSARDADNDGYENGFDTCPFTANLDADPRTSTGPDLPAPGDGLDSACDTTPGATFNDADSDGYSNRLDNCPLVANPDQADNNEVSVNLFPADGGPGSDGIGDACDPGSVPDGSARSATVKNAICNGTADSDLNNASVKQPDGFCDPEETYLGTLVSGAGSACPVTTANAAWPPDFNNDRIVNVTDRTQLVLRISSDPNITIPANKRFDLNRSGTIAISDRTAEINFIGMICTP